MWVRMYKMRIEEIFDRGSLRLAERGPLDQRWGILETFETWKATGHDIIDSVCRLGSGSRYMCSNSCRIEIVNAHLSNGFGMTRKLNSTGWCFAKLICLLPGWDVFHDIGLTDDEIISFLELIMFELCDVMAWQVHPRQTGEGESSSVATYILSLPLGLKMEGVKTHISPPSRGLGPS